MIPFSPHSIRPQRSDDGRPLLCRVKNPALSQALETKILMKVYCKKHFFLLHTFLVFQYLKKKSHLCLTPAKALHMLKDPLFVPYLASTKATMCFQVHQHKATTLFPTDIHGTLTNCF